MFEFWFAPLLYVIICPLYLIYPLAPLLLGIPRKDSWENQCGWLSPYICCLSILSVYYFDLRVSFVNGDFKWYIDVRGFGRTPTKFSLFLIIHKIQLICRGVGIIYIVVLFMNQFLQDSIKVIPSHLEHIPHNWGVFHISLVKWKVASKLFIMSVFLQHYRHMLGLCWPVF